MVELFFGQANVEGVYEGWFLLNLCIMAIEAKCSFGSCIELKAIENPFLTLQGTFL